jgi:hypothetical protein
MKCYECKQAGRSEEAVGLCAACSVGLCLAHMRQADDHKNDPRWFSCPHDALRISRPAGTGV